MNREKHRKIAKQETVCSIGFLQLDFLCILGKDVLRHVTYTANAE